MHGIGDGDEVRVWNDIGEFFVPAKVAPGVMPGQVIVYNGWEPYMFRNWRGPMDIEPRLVKWLHLALNCRVQLRPAVSGDGVSGVSS